MSNQIECEEKFFCPHSDKLISFILNELSFEFQEKLKEEDVYLKDKKERYIQKDTCLRVRKTNNSSLEITRKVAVNNDERIKSEKNISLPVNKEKRLFSLLNHMGITPYCIVSKKRSIYSKKIENLSYNIVLDVINDKTAFLEIEIVSQNYNPDLSSKLQEFIQKFQKFPLKKANINYRDFVLKEK